MTRIARELRARAACGRPVRIAKGGPSHLVPIPGDPGRLAPRIDIGGLNRILYIDPDARRCTAEPGVTFADLLRETLKHGLMPAVVPELSGITLGGAVAGCSVESSSHRYGGFHDSCLEYELVSGAGDVVTCSPEKDPLLFEMIHGSYGTLGILTRLTFRLVPAKRYVRIEYLHFRSFERCYRELIERCRSGDAEFIDAIVHGPRLFVVCLGRGVDDAPYVSSYKWLNIYYRSTAARAVDYLSTTDYCFRYDTECHWMTRRVPLLTSRPVRFLIGKQVLGSTNLLRWSRRLEPLLGLRRRPDLICDVFIPARRAADFYSWYERALGFFPLWVVPYRMSRPYPWIAEEYAKRLGDDLFFDCAIYGMPNGDLDVDLSEILERKTYELGGIKTLISRNHYTRERFWSIYNRRSYEEVKRRMDPNGVFAGLYEKCHRIAPRGTGG